MKRTSLTLRTLSAGALALLVAACGSSSGSSGTDGDTNNGGVNRAPVAEAGNNQAVNELSTVSLAGSGTDPDAGDVLSYLWIQTAGSTVTLSSSTSASVTFTAPDVPAGAPESLTFELTVTDADGLSDSDIVTVTVAEPAAAVSISGTLTFELPDHNAQCDGLNFNSIDINPIRGATVQLVDNATQAVVQSTVSDEQGGYSFSNVDSMASVFVRVRAELKKTGSPAWDVEVRDNTSQTNRPLDQRPIYVLDGPSASPNGQDEVRDLLATTGWNMATESFTGVRAAAPFSILDAIYAVTAYVATADPQVVFDPLDVYWSVNNTSAGSGDVDTGALGTSFYVDGGLYLLGKDGDDIEEFDTSLVAHEWSHYFEDRLSRSDSIGGSHSSFDRLDARVAFGEGMAYALGGIALDEPVYCDAFWAGGRLRGFDIRLEDENTIMGGGVDTQGWYSEFSILKIMYDLLDDNDDGADTGSIGLSPLYTVWVGPQASTQAFTTAFSYFEALRNAVGVNENALIDALMLEEGIEPAGIDEWGSTETNDAGSPNSLPVYTTIPTDGTVVNLCSSAEFDSVGGSATGNKLNTHRFLRVDIPSQQRYRFLIQADAATLAMLPPDDPGDDRDQSDPDMLYFRTGVVQNLCVDLRCNDVEGGSGDANEEIFTTVNPLPAGTYVVDFWDWRYEDRQTDSNYPETTCFDISITPTS